MSARWQGKRILFVTGKLAAPALQQTVARLSTAVGFTAEFFVAKISVAALMTPDWLAGKLKVDANCDLVLLPGWCHGDVSQLSQSIGGLPIDRGPKDLRDLPAFFQRPGQANENYGRYDIEILAEINNADRLPIEEIVRQAEKWVAAGADVIDLGCSPGSTWQAIGDVVRELRARSIRCSVDSFNAKEIATAAQNGAELVLSVNSTNCDQAKDWGVEVVAIPDRADQSDWLTILEQTMNVLDRDGVKYRIDPILNPVGFGFADSLGRYLEARRHFPNTPMMMGIGNATELLEVDSQGVNTLLTGFCQEVGIRSVLTTEVIHWATSSVREIAIARQLMKHAIETQTLPKHIDSRLVMLRGGKPVPSTLQELRELKDSITDPNFRIFLTADEIVIFNHRHFEHGTDPFLLFERISPIDSSHAFYLGWELMKAATALQLGKRYVQDESLDWGLLTTHETSHRLHHRRERTQSNSED